MMMLMFATTTTAITTTGRRSTLRYSRGNNIISSIIISSRRRNSSGTSRNGSSSIQYLLKMLSLQDMVNEQTLKSKDNHDFSYALGLSHEAINSKQFFFNENQPYKLTFQYNMLSSKRNLQLLLPAATIKQEEEENDLTTTATTTTTITNNTISLSTYLAILDDVTTWSLLLAKLKTKPRPGVSVSFQIEWGPGAINHMKMLQEKQLQEQNKNNTNKTNNSHNNNNVDVDINTTVLKVGRNLGFVRAEIVDKETKQLICYGYHTKFLPLSSKALDLATSNFGIKLLSLYHDYTTTTTTSNKNNNNNTLGSTTNSSTSSQNQHQEQLSDLFSFDRILQFVDDDDDDNLTNSTGSNKNSNKKAIFNGSSKHSSFGGKVHGGCQAIIMELVGRKVAMYELEKTSKKGGGGGGGGGIHLQSIQLSYISTSSYQMLVEVEIISLRKPHFISLRVQLKREKDNVLVSEGILNFYDSVEHAPVIDTSKHGTSRL